ncbi:glutamate dehydrogenase (NAD(+)) [Sugiyamaella lignohabitans]|uniref:NAD-specific glutamate dehydrogenase n=1 Tax=Sugiyamaella lignohabitans TaxID=796027 RepID=A0A167ELA5_9ASCO|nr:glutamate dehydrogenase (NAD(+)) [Sugiyamaella lignohabitans]ANB14208.1 glutamate dehydrogenase (NAD(+)) [Sugiyamaella lignohabitans]
MDEIDRRGFIPEALIENETKWFYNNLGIDDSYFATESIDSIVSYIHSLYAAKVAAYARDDKKLVIRLDRESEDHAVYIDTSTPGVTNLDGPRYEKRIDEKYLTPSTPENAYRLETFRSVGAAIDTSGVAQNLRCYFVYKCNFPSTKEPVSENETDLLKISDKAFYEKATDRTKMFYQSIISQVVRRTGPVIELYEVDGSRERRIIIGYRQGSTPGYFAALSDLYHYYGLTSTRKYVEQFANGVTIVSLYLVPTNAPQTARTLEELKALKQFPPIESSIHQIVKEASLLYCVPQNTFQDHFAKGDLSLQESAYAHCGFIFVSHFLNRLGSEYTTLMSVLDLNNSSHVEVMERLKRRLRSETFTREYIQEIINSNIDVIRQLYLQFANDHYVQSHGEGDGFLPTLSYQRLQTQSVMSSEELESFIRRTATNDHEVLVLEALLRFNNHVLKTNFYTPTKVALSFRLKPDFLPSSEYAQPLFGMFLVVGQEFRGFHLRFRDIARGGIRIVKSRNKEAYSINARSLFDENYNLANTQQRKNKDIPEGGAKGVILLNNEHQDKATQAFQKYIDAILDLLLPGVTPGIKDAIVDKYGSSEILFMGPDENTAGLVDWATEHAKKRGAPFWKSFFTGKSPELGGIPHDEYGMTSLSVREYVKGIYRKLEIDPSQIKKLQTGGPDGDLGSNEILLSNEKYVSIVDGSGVICDPNGLNHSELVRLAKTRQMISEFDISKLSSDGYRVLVDDKDVKLPNGTIVENGTTFRNLYHLIAADEVKDLQVFVPCGGRPEAIDVNNVGKLIDENGKSKIPYIVEGANLFITQNAKLRLEAAGAIMFKDASANKGGVTSSSLEVLASLALNDTEFYENMCVHNGIVPQFYKDYVKEVQSIIQNNARLEFEAIWREHQLTKKTNSLLSDELSHAINDLTEELSKSNLWQDEEFRNSILGEALPKELVKKVGLETILERVPDSYLKAIFGSYLAGRFIYEHGASPSQFAFFEYMVEKRKSAAPATPATAVAN